MLLFYLIMCQRSYRLESLKLSEHITLGTWILCCYFAISVVLGKMTSIASSPGLSRRPINTVEDIEHSESREALAYASCSLLYSYIITTLYHTLRHEVIYFVGIYFAALFWRSRYPNSNHRLS